ncbi:hypothetical protein HanRHA438_Chr12g0556311 [Helianthus annuus]|nr:hypothetical protein HanRHA438_Chr12g0556311 [Helianthus annuus]
MSRDLESGCDTSQKKKETPVDSRLVEMKDGLETLDELLLRVTSVSFSEVSKAFEYWKL